MIGYLREPSGGLGNRLFHYNFMLQLARLLGQSVVQPWSRDIDFVAKTSTSFRHFMWTQNRHARRLGPLDIADVTPRDFRNFILTDFGQVEHVKLVSPILGEVFFESCFYDPKELMAFEPGFDNNAPFVAAHIRGGDFATWNPEAILPASYYIEAISVALNKPERQNLPVVIVTDDLAQPAIEEIKLSFPHNVSLGEEFRSSVLGRDEVLRDFRLLGSAETIISSPSTFAIWSSILGKNEHVYHSKAWVEKMANQGDNFWVKLIQGGNEYYRCTELI